METLAFYFENKISSAEQFSDFEKKKDDETKTYADLVKLAEKYELEGNSILEGVCREFWT